jgi:hypothetical protein
MQKEYNDVQKHQCAPGIAYDETNRTCFSIDDLISIVKAYNIYAKSNNKQEITMSNDKRYLLVELSKRFNDVCNGDQACLTKQSFMNELVDIKHNIFRPDGPVKPTEWLRTDQIDNVMNQYTQEHKNFYFLGAVELDCDKYKDCALYNLNFDEYLNNGKNKLGIVYNLDKRGQSGSHWVSMLIDIEKGHVYFSDSTGHAPIENINDIVSKFETYYKNKFNKEISKFINTKKYQTDGSECGVYSMYFIDKLLSGKSFDEIINDPPNFKEINTCRARFFYNKSGITNASPHAKCYK